MLDFKTPLTTVSIGYVPERWIPTGKVESAKTEGLKAVFRKKNQTKAATDAEDRASQQNDGITALYSLTPDSANEKTKSTAQQLSNE